MKMIDFENTVRTLWVHSLYCYNGYLFFRSTPSLSMKEAMPVLSAGAGELHKCKNRNKHTYVCTMTLIDLCLHVGLHETLALLTSQLRPDANHKEDMVFLKDVFSERSLSYLMKVCWFCIEFTCSVICYKVFNTCIIYLSLFFFFRSMRSCVSMKGRAPPQFSTVPPLWLRM